MDALPGWLGAEVRDRDGRTVGRIADVLFDVRLRTPAWLAVGTDAGVVLLPGGRARHRSAAVFVPWPSELIRSAPLLRAPPGELVPVDGAILALHFGIRCGGGPWRGVVTPLPSRSVPAGRPRVPAA